MNPEEVTFLTTHRERPCAWQPIEPQLIVPFRKGEWLPLVVILGGLLFAFSYFAGFVGAGRAAGKEPQVEMAAVEGAHR